MILVLGTILLTALLGAPLFVIMGATTMALFYSFGGAHYEHIMGYQSLVVSMTELTTKNVFLAIPFFVGAGAIMTEGGIAQRLVRLANSFVGWMPGGLAVSAIGSAMIFAAISASSPVTLIAVGSIMFPALLKAGYRENFSLGLVTSAGSLGCLVPPSLPMIIYALAVSSTGAVDIGDLFLAGIGPAFLIAGLWAIYCVWEGLRMPETREKFSFKEMADAFREGIWALFLPVIILGGIYSGFFTATEAAAVSMVYAVIVTVFIYKELTLKRIPALFVESSVLIGSIVLIIVFSFALNSFLVESDVAGLALKQMQEWNLGPAGFFLTMNLLLIVVGALMDAISAILIFAPLLAPIALAVGIDPLHLAIVFIINMEIGYLMPPVATNLFVSSAVFRKPFGQVARSVIPTMVLIIVGLGIVMYVPTIPLGMVNMLHGRPAYQAFPWDGAPVPVAAAPDLPGSPAAASVGGGAMSLQEMMKAAKEDAAATPAAADSEPPRAKSLQELMEEAKARTAAEAAREAAVSAEAEDFTEDIP
jgi:C4-dicarboxylate transporter, DctM subunit